MTATKIDGTAIAKAIRERLHAEIEAAKKTNPRYKPSLKIIQGICPRAPFLGWYTDVALV
jgi:methylenetetrahydrofolate dehydrogenase (NADP+)/methenyltetrahydrofolate cyclohydrolase/formyltetrahydrofolate synthetase